MKRFALGTVQFGERYGVANKIGKPSREEVFSILELAYKEGVDTLDTAYLYGDSEEIIGEFISEYKQSFNIISKLPLANYEKGKIEKQCLKSLKRLRQNRIYGYLVHEFGSPLKNKSIWNDMELLKKKRLVRKVGVSLYRTEELTYLLDNNFNLDIVQIPYNILDHRFEDFFYALKRKNIEIYVRSVFLQGIFFLDTQRISKDFARAEEPLWRLHEISETHKIPVYALCLCFVLSNPFIDKAIIGVDLKNQLKQNLGCLEFLDKTKNIYGLLKSLKFHDEKTIIPFNWK